MMADDNKSTLFLVALRQPFGNVAELLNVGKYYLCVTDSQLDITFK